MLISSVYAHTLVSISGFSFVISLVSFCFGKVIKHESVYNKMAVLSAAASAYYMMLTVYFTERNSVSAIKNMLVTMSLLPFFLYLVSDVTLALIEKKNRFQTRLQYLNLVFSGFFSILAVFDCFFGTHFIITGDIETKSELKAFHVIGFSNFSMVYLTFVTTLFYFFAFELFTSRKVNKNNCMPFIFGYFMFVVTCTSDFAILLELYDFYYLQHFGFFGIAIGFAWLLFKKFETTFQQLQKSAQNLKKIQASRIGSERFRVMGMMSGGIAHEINNPLGTALLYCETMKDQLAEKDLNNRNFIETLKKFDNQLARVSKVSERLMVVNSEQSTHAMQSESIDVLIRSQATTWKNYVLSLGAQLQLPVETFSGSLTCRKSEIEQVLSNLIHNAADAVRFLTQKWVRIETFKSATHFVISIEDSGSGIDPEIAEKIFDPFFSTKPVGTGTGLGLSICAGLVESHGGKLELDKYSKNTKFLVQFPIELLNENNQNKERQNLKGTLS